MEAAGQWLREKGLAKVGQARRPREQPGLGRRRSSTATSAPSSSSRARPTSRPRPTTSPRWCRTWPTLVVAKGADARRRAADRARRPQDRQEGEHRGRHGRPLRGGRRQRPRLLPPPQDGRGVNAVLVELDGGTRSWPTTSPCTSRSPSRRTSPATRSRPTRSRRSARRCSSITKAEGKPEQAWPKIVEGRLNAWFKDQVLLEQGFVQDDKKTITELLGDATLVRFAQVFIGA